MFTSSKLNRLYNLKLPVFKLLGERTNERPNHSENKQIYHPNFVLYVETSSSGDINSMSYHLTAFELTSQLLYMNFPSLECKIFLERSEIYVAVICCVVLRDPGNISPCLPRNKAAETTF